MTCKSRYLDAITTLFVFVTVTEIKCQGLQYDSPFPEFGQQDALPNMCLCLCDTCKFWDEQYRNMTYVELCCLEYHRFSPLSSDLANNNGNNIVLITSYFIRTFLHYVFSCCHLEAARRRFIFRWPIARQLDNQIFGKLPESGGFLIFVMSIPRYEFAG